MPYVIQIKQCELITIRLEKIFANMKQLENNEIPDNSENSNGFETISFVNVRANVVLNSHAKYTFLAKKIKVNTFTSLK